MHQRSVRVPTRGRGFYDVTEKVAQVVAESGVTTGLCTVFVRHTERVARHRENADPAVLRDLARWMERLAPESRDYEHDDEGPDDMPGHLRSAITRSSESVPVAAGALALGTWQAVYVWEHRAAGHMREIVVHVAGT